MSADLKRSRKRFGKIYKAYDMILIGLGANLPTVEGPPLATLQAALDLMPAFGISVLRCSSFYRTPAVAHDVQPPYVNAVAVVAAALPATDLLASLHRLEAQFGRVRHVRWAPRTLDLDLLDYEGQIVTSGHGAGREASGLKLPLALPHPGIDKRGFVLVPLAEVAPEWRHPVGGATVGELLNRLKAADGPSAVAGIERI
ncbi:MAG: 2-amino-4-hydroxy-6-hydroxymethyldihydropteridine diphosphokinase [Parvibaculum sp.]|nr:2-amino-4-hydroxy-6-hydroxymethyldihydropteridine diphosphokinase [Parvibaculum sp.]